MRTKRQVAAFLSGLMGAAIVMTSLLAGLVTQVADASSANISKSYKAADAISNGSIVSLDFKRADYVAPANTANAARLIGVVLASEDSLLAVNPVDGAVQVATSGSVNAYVSTLNGDIKVGDAVAVSPFNGVGMKASEGGERVIGLAQTDFNQNTDGATIEKIRDKDGNVREVAVGYIRLNIAIGTNNPAQTESALQRAAKLVTGKSIPTARLLIAATIALVALIAIVNLTYSSIHGSIVSIGRNPLAKYAIFRATGLVFVLVFFIAVVAGGSIFFLLR